MTSLHALLLKIDPVLRRAALGDDATAGSQIAKLLVERAVQWSDHLEKRHVVFSSTDDLSSARHELSAYLSQVINDPATPHAALWHLAQQTFDRSRAGTGEFYAGIVVRNREVTRCEAARHRECPVAGSIR